MQRCIVRMEKNAIAMEQSALYQKLAKEIAQLGTYLSMEGHSVALDFIWSLGELSVENLASGMLYA